MRAVYLLLVFQFYLLSEEFVLINGSFGLNWNSYFNPRNDYCLNRNAKLMSLLNLLCKTTQSGSSLNECYACYYRAGNTYNGRSQLRSLNACSSRYIVESQYSACATDLQDIVNGNRVAGNPFSGYCSSGYCDFVRCVRRINSQQLISTCYTESLGERELEEETDRVSFFTNITACILAKYRCAQYSPISGKLLLRPYTSSGNTNYGAQVQFLNTLQVSGLGDLRIISFPTTVTKQSDFFCSLYPYTQQAAFDNYNC